MRKTSGRRCKVDLKGYDYMGGRGGSSGVGRVSSEQTRIMNNMKKALSKDKHSSDLNFKMNADGTVSYSYIKTDISAYVHGGKMIDPRKNDIYERKTVYSGAIHKDGMRVKNKTEETKTLIKKGKR
jgi:hypothetical protein